MTESFSATSKLCDVCRVLNIPEYFLPPAKGEPYTKDGTGALLYKQKELGSSKEIARRSVGCSFCVLVHAATKQDGEDAFITVRSVECGKNRTTPDANIVPAYYIQVYVVARSFGRYTHIQLLADDAGKIGLSRDFRAREPSLDRFDVSQVRAWLDLCYSRHGDSCRTLEGHDTGTLSSRQPHNLLVIDLISMCVCNKPAEAVYTALSYCWPSKTYLTLLKTNRKALFEHGALLDNMSDLPGTIQDAMHCAKELSYRYLWIDALCIVQDDSDHKAIQLRQMDLVYSCAEVTLVCAYPVARGTSDTCSGFPGYNKAERARARHVAEVDGLRLMASSLDVEECLLTTRWSTRCWTFQEELLSRRLLYFTPMQVYFQCSQGLFCEDTDCERISMDAHVQPGNTLWNPKAKYPDASSTGNDWGAWTLSRKPLDGLPQMLQSYEMALSFYTYRDVSFSSDILNAFEGVRVVLSEAMGTSFWQGIPEKLLPQALCWQLRGPYRRRLNKPVGTQPAELLFPSWTWAGWESRVNLNVHMAIQTYRTDAEWYIINKDGVATRLDVQPQWMTLSRQRPSASLLRAFLPKLVPREDVDANSDVWREARILGCWTSSASFLLNGSYHTLSSNNHEAQWRDSTNFAIKDRWGTTAGCILLPKDYFQNEHLAGQTREFILISRGLKSDSEFLESMNISYFDESVYSTRGWCHLNVMMISRIDEFTAERVGVGIMSKEAWGAASPETTFVKLV